MMENRPALTSPDGSRNRNPSKRRPRPLYSRDSTQEHQEIPHCYQGESIIEVVVKEENLYVLDDDPCKEEKMPAEIRTDLRHARRKVKAKEEGLVRIKEEEIPPEISTNHGNTQRDMEEEEGHVRINMESLLLDKMEESPRMNTNTKEFIRVVQPHECIYDPRSASYRSKGSRRNAWYTVGAQMWRHWDDFSSTLKDAKVTVMKQKWKNLKDVFTRHRKLVRDYRSGLAATRPVEYVHGKELAFLIPVIEMRQTESSWEGAGPSQEVEEVPQQREAPPSPPAETGHPETVEENTPSSIPLPTPAQDPRPAAPGPSRRKTLARGRATGNEVHDRLMSVLQKIARPAPRLSSEACFLLSMEDNLKRLPVEKKLDVMASMITLIRSALSESEEQSQPMIPPQSSQPQATQYVHTPPLVSQQMPTYPIPHHTHGIHYPPQVWPARPSSPYGLPYPSISQTPSPSTFSSGSSDTEMTEDSINHDSGFSHSEYQDQ